jgi:large subunit ribosomal protein L22
VPEARTVLAFTQRAAALEISKVLKSAVANAEANHGLIGDELLVYAVTIDEGPTIKRWRARARGRVARIRKRTCHITIRLAENPKANTRRAQSAKAQAEAAPPESESKPKRRSPAKKKEVNA